ncbi:MAG: tRNA (cytidine(34)-2'-O)-methyltransferase [Bacilli bacterium]|nr:tRNA (cytidine(34)-2'-O)-methyltransferase [Bacilli bacterium]
MSINIVLYEPEIPQNTGNIMRTCVATNTILHLIKPLGFSLSQSKIKRSGVNYIDKLEYKVYESFEDFVSKNVGEFYFFSRYGLNNFHSLKLQDFKKDYYFFIGKESTGIPKEILQKYLDRCVRLPMTENVRSLNVSNVAAIAIYEALRQQDYPNLSNFEPESMKGKDFLLK